MPHNLSIFRFQFSPSPARYYNSDLSIWLSVDPMADKYPSLSPYTYCGNNPVRLVDPDGRDLLNTDYRNLKGELLYKTNDGLDQTILIPDSKIVKFKQRIEMGFQMNKVDDPIFNKQELYPLGQTPQQYKESKDGSASNIISDIWTISYQNGYNEAYTKGKKNLLKFIIFSFMGSIDKSADLGGGMQDQYTGWLVGQEEGLHDKKVGNINAMNPQKTYKNNRPLIVLKK